MSNSFFHFKQFTIHQDRCAMKVTTDASLFGGWVSHQLKTPSDRVFRAGINNKPKTILDIGTGTGLLALMYAQKNPNAFIDAIETDKDAFEQAKETIMASPWSNRIGVFHGDARNFAFPHKYNVIISNPPFYDKELISGNNKKNVAQHDEGLLIRELLTIIRKNLEPDGLFCLLLPFKRNREIKKLLVEHEFTMLQMTFVRQSPKHDYFRMMLTGKLKTNAVIETMIDEISIWYEKQQYTPQFIELLKDYYINL